METFALAPIDYAILIIYFAFVLGIVGTYLSKEPSHPEKYAEMEVRSLTGAGAEKAVEH